jgi:phage-related protein
MATTGSGRGPIKVGSGYIDVFPKINQKQLRETRAQLEKQMGASGKKAGKALSDGISTSLANVPKKVAQAAQKAQKELQKGAQDSKKVLKRIEQEITRDYGKEAGKRFREAAELEKKKAKLLQNTSAETRRALQATVRGEQQAARDTARSWETAERERLRMIRERTKAAEKAARDEAAAYRRAQQQMREELRRTLAEARTARLADLRGQMDAHRDQVRSLRAQLLDYRRQMEDHSRAVGRGLTNLRTGWRRQGEAIERLGTNITEAGRLVTTNLLMPLGAVSTMLTTIGVQSADMRILGQMGLSAAGVSKQTSAKEMRQIQEYAINTPFSIDTMHEYQMKIIRSIAGNDKEWYKKSTKGEAANRAAGKTTDIIMAIGDTMARAGNLDPEMFKRAMYAVDRIMDMDKAPTRNINQLVQATGIPAGELARMFGFENAGAFWKQVGTPVAKGGGISGQDMINNLLMGWDPNYFVKGKNGKPKVDPKTGQPIVNSKDHSTAGGSAGFGERMTSATISGRISQLKERAQYELGSLFAEEDPKTGEYRYTGLGESIMGKASGKDKNGNTIYEGGLLQKVQELGGDQKDNVTELLKTFFSSIGTFVDQIQWFSDWLNAHPQVKEVFANLLKMAAAALPFIIALGLGTKLLGKVNKILGAALTPLAGMFKGLRGVTRTGRQVGSAVRAGMSGDGDAGSIRDRMTNRYRERRTELRGGDIRGPVARARDRVTGRDSGSNQLRQSIRDTEDAIRQAEDGITDLQRQIREVNSVSIRQLVDQFAGSGNNTLQGAAQNANQQVTQATQGVNQLNNQNLNQVSGEVSDLQDKVRSLTEKVRDSKAAFGNLNDQKLTQLKVTIDGAEGTVADLKNKTDNAAVAVSDLNRKNLNSLQEQFRDTTKTAAGLETKVKEVRDRVNNLNRAGLGNVRKQFNQLNSAANEVYKTVGTTKSGVNGRITTLNGRSLKSIIAAVKDLKDALDGADGKADNLNSSLNDISAHAPGGGGGGKKKKKAMGGVLPGYTPGVDVHRFFSPTAGTLDLSGGEAVMRPEFTAAVGEQEVNRLNQIARTKGVHGVRDAMQFANGGIIEKLGLQGIIDTARGFNLGVDVIGASRTMDMDSSSRPLGGGVQRGIIGSGTDSGHFIGGDTSVRLDTVRNFMSKDAWTLLRRLPSNGASQVLGTIGGALAPVAGEHFWDDVWKGSGNIVERGNTFLQHMFSPSAITKIITNSLDNIWDTITGFFNSATSFASDPYGTIKDALSGVWEMTKESYAGVTSTVQGLKEIWQSPKDYAEQVVSDIYSTAKDSLPNMKGLFDFSEDDKLTAKKPDFDKVIESGGPGTGRALTWARTQHGLPYQWGGNGNPSWDCSGFMSAIESVIRGEKPHRRWATGAFSGSKAPSGWIRGLKAPFMIGITNKGVGHTAGTLNGVNVESRGGAGVIVGPGARGWNSSLFTDTYGFKPSIPAAYATGTLSASPGLALVGEKGPELIDFGKGGQRVYNNQDTEALLAVGSRPISVTVQEAKHETTPQAILRGFQWIDAMYGSRL